MNYAQLDRYQLKVVNENTNLLVIAGPGSGKTTTIIRKVEKLLENNVPEDIVLISFTNKSVEDIKKRIKSNIFVTTFHKLAIDILKYNCIYFKICPTDLLEYIIDEYFSKLSAKNKKKILKLLHIKSLSNDDKTYLSVKKNIITFINLFKTYNYKFDKIYELYKTTSHKELLLVIIKIFNDYENEKQSQGLLDFDDLIISATQILNTAYNYKHFKFIIIDEFQDTSLIRINLIKAIYKGCHPIITVVGDDAQSIYHFSGCDINIFLNFKNYFDNSKILFLKNTYRNSQELINISEKFISKNPQQIQKNMKSTFSIKKPINIVYYYSGIISFKKILLKISKVSNDILVLGRNQNDILEYVPNYINYNDENLECYNIKFRYLTIHSAKGLESEYVILLNFSNNITGLPNRIINSDLINSLLCKDEFPFAEERRVFFVAITRCKYKTYIMTPINNPSIFLKELKKIMQKK